MTRASCRTEFNLGLCHTRTINLDSPQLHETWNSFFPWPTGESVVGLRFPSRENGDG